MGLLRCSRWCRGRRAVGRAHTPAGCDAPQPHLLPPVCQEVCDPLTGGGWHSKLGEFGVEDVWDDSVEC